jgi:hypothetical protein
MEPMRSAPLCSESLPHLLPVMQQAPPLPPLSRCSANQVLVAASRLHLRRRFHQSGPCCRTAGPRLRPSSSRYWSSLSDIMTLRLSNLKAFKMVRCSGKVFHEIGNWSKPSAARVPPAKPLRRPLQCGVPSRPRPRLGLGSTSRNTRRHSGGKCFRCLAKDHKIVHCLNCLGNGHFARHCKAPPSSARHRATALPPASSSKPNINSRLAFPSIHSRLTYPPGSVHNRLTFPARSYAAAVSSSAMADEHHQYVPNQRPSQGRAVVVAEGALSAELVKLRRKAVVLSTHNVAPQESAADVAYELHRLLRIPHWNITVAPHKPENFLARFDYPEQQESALRAGSLFVGTTPFVIHPWRLDAATRPIGWNFHVKICIERLPLHAWSAEGIKQVLGDVCIFDHMEEATLRQENTTIFSFFGWMANPDLLPRAKTVAFFAERAGRSSIGDGPPPVDSSLPSPPEGGEGLLLIHLDHYYYD